MKNVEKQVRKFRKEFKIKGVPDMSELRQVIRSFHYQLLTFEGNEELLQKLGQYERSRYVPSFCCTKNRQNYLFYSAEIHDRDLPFIFAHEIGHIYMNHLNREENIHDTPEYKDRESNEFASQLLQEQKRKPSLKVPFAVLILSLALFVSSLTLSNLSELITPVTTSITKTQESPEEPETIVKELESVVAPENNKIPQVNKISPMQEPITETTMQQPEEISETVVVTRTGKRYHKPTCWHLYNREGLRNLNIDQAVLERYTPCADCY